MKKTLLLLVLLGCLAALLSGCGNDKSAGAPQAQIVDQAQAEDIPVDLEIREKLFVAQTNEIYVNDTDYLGKTIKYEGMFFALSLAEGNETTGMVMRYGPGCCGDDGVVGFEVRWEEDAGIRQPADNDWVEVTGVLEQYEEQGIPYLRLNVLRMRPLMQRGAETVLQ